MSVLQINGLVLVWEKVLPSSFHKVMPPVRAAGLPLGLLDAPAPTRNLHTNICPAVEVMLLGAELLRGPKPGFFSRAKMSKTPKDIFVIIHHISTGLKKIKLLSETWNLPGVRERSAKNKMFSTAKTVPAVTGIRAARSRIVRYVSNKHPSG